MRAALKQFVGELENIYRVIQQQGHSRQARFQLPKERVDTHEELIQILYEFTLQLESPSYYESGAWRDAPGYAHLAVGERFQKVFSGRVNETYRKALHGVDGGLRSVADEFVESHLSQTLQEELHQKILEFYEIEYGSGAERDYQKMWQDHEDYLTAYQEIHSTDVQARKQDFIRGSSNNSNCSNRPLGPMMHDIYMLHPRLTVRPS